MRFFVMLKLVAYSTGPCSMLIDLTVGGLFLVCNSFGFISLLQAVPEIVFSSLDHWGQLEPPVHM